MYLFSTLEKYDMALYTFLAPLFAPTFFPQFEPAIQLALTYGISGLILFIRPVGVWFWTRMLPYRCVSFDLKRCFVGVYFLTLLFSLLPGFETGGYLSIAGFICLRLGWTFFSAGVKAISQLYFLEDKSSKAGIRGESLRQSLAMAGMFLASFSGIFFSWRVCFFIGGAVSLVLYTLIHNHLTPGDFHSPERFPPKKTPFLAIVRKSFAPLLHTTLTTGIGYITYTLAFVVMNGLLVMSYPDQAGFFMSVNTGLLVLDMILMLALGRILQHRSPTAVMVQAVAGLLFTVGAGFIFLTLENMPLFFILRILIVFWGVAYSCVLGVHQKDYLKNFQNPYLLQGLGGTLGSGLFGKVLPSLCFWIYGKIESFFLMGFLVSAIICFILLQVQNQRDPSPLKS